MSNKLYVWMGPYFFQNRLKSLKFESRASFFLYSGYFQGAFLIHFLKFCYRILHSFVQLRYFEWLEIVKQWVFFGNRLAIAINRNRRASCLPVHSFAFLPAKLTHSETSFLRLTNVQVYTKFSDLNRRWPPNEVAVNQRFYLEIVDQ